MKVWITRPIEDGITLSDELKAHGHDVILSPLISVRYRQVDLNEICEATHFVVTSRNALRVLSAAPDISVFYDRPVFAVGEATATLAKVLGFKTIIVGEGYAASLVDLIKQEVAGDYKLIHLRGERVAFDLKGALNEFGIRLDEQIVYGIDESTALSDDLVQRISRGEIDAVILMSPRMAKLYIRLMQKAGLEVYFGKIAHFCISSDVANELNSIGVITMHIAANPDRAEIISLINKIEA